jgi:tungsten cofactor oxidoreducase radical SAM maturase
MRLRIGQHDDNTFGLAQSDLRRLGLKPGEQFVVQQTADGIALHRALNDAQRVHLEVTTRCNLHCITCIRNVWADPLGEMSLGTFDRIVEGLRAFRNLKEIHFAGYGEPLLHPHIVEMVQRAKALGVRVTLTTNGTRLDAAMATELMDARLDRLFVSIDSPRPDAFREIRVGAELDAVVENLKRLQELRAQRHSYAPTIGLEFVVMKQNRSDVAELPALARAVGASFVMLTHLEPHTPAMAGEIAYNGAGFEVQPSAGWAVRVGDHIEWGTLVRPRGRWGARRQCRFVEGKGLVIGWDGGVSPCYALMHSYPYFIFGRRKHVSRYVLGNVNRTPLADIWTGEEYVLFRARVGIFQFPSCVDCGADCDYARHNDDCWGNAPSRADCLWAQEIIQCP